MLHGIYSSAITMEAATRHQDVIAQNLSNAQVPGYRRVQIQHGTFDDTLLESREQLAARSTMGIRGVDAMIDWQPGQLNQTGRTFDIAIEGPGFFEVETASGKMYTRNGGFVLNDQGELVTGNGNHVQGLGGRIQFNPQNSAGEISIGVDGSISAGGVLVGQLKLVQFEDPNVLTQAGTTLFKAPENIRPLSDQTDGVGSAFRQGFLEQSNVQPIHELVDMIASQRRHEAAARTMRTILRTIERHTNLQGGN